MEKGLKLYVWEKVLCRYEGGIAFTLAHNTNEARRLIRKRLIADGWIGTYVEDLKDFEKEPRIVYEPEAFYVEGGE